MNYYHTLEFTTIRKMLADHAVSGQAKRKALGITPFLAEQECKARLIETTNAKKLLEALGNPPMDSLEELEKVLELIKAGGMLLPEQFHILDRFLATCKRMNSYLKRGESISLEMAAYSAYVKPLEALREEIGAVIRGQGVSDEASSTLRTIRRKLEHTKSAIQQQLERLLCKNPSWFSEHYITQRGRRSVLPVRHQFRSKVEGTTIESSGSGATFFIEPRSVQKSQQEVQLLEMEEENEIIKILYTLTAYAESHLPELEQNYSTIEELDFLFAKAKFSVQLRGIEVKLTTDRMIALIEARHPLLDPEMCVPLNLSFGEKKRGIVITGPNTGGKTVALKTVGLLSLMAQSGLHIPASPNSVLPMNNLVLCDIGDNQSIAASLSTFSSHMSSIIEILRNTNKETLVLLDELGSGTDPAEGMGLAIAIIEELLERDCLFMTTTHYGEVKDFAAKTPAIISARMAFDKENLKPLYRVELGEVGESCAFYIAQKLGLPSKLLERAHNATYGEFFDYGAQSLSSAVVPKIKKIEEKKPRKELPQYRLGDSVMVSPEQKVGIVYLPTQEDGTVGVQIQKNKQKISYKRLRLIASAEMLYPADYDFSTVFNTAEVRKARHQMGRKHNPNVSVEYKEGETWQKE